MKMIAVVALAMFLVLTVSARAMAQAGDVCGVPDNGRLQQTLNLTDEQAEAMQAILQERFESRLLLHKRHHDELEQHRTETQARLSTVLDDSQIEQLEAFRLWRESIGRKGGRR